MGDVTVFDYRLKNGKKKYGYRFEMASVNGVRKWENKRGFSTKAEAQKAGRTAQVDYERRGTIYEPSNMSYEDLFQMWIKVAPIKDLTKNTYNKINRVYIRPHIGHLKISSITRSDLRNILIDLINQGYSKNTLTCTKSLLSKTLEFAVEEKYLLESPAVGLHMPKIERPLVPQRTASHIFVKKEQMEMIFKEYQAGHPYYIPLLLGYTCGLRVGEACGITWDNIDFDNKTLTVNKQVQRYRNDLHTTGKGIWYISSPKYDSYRTIAIPDSLLDKLKDERDRQIANQIRYEERYIHYYVNNKKEINQEKDGNEIFFVTVRENGGLVTPQTVQRASGIIRKKFNIPGFDFHSLRHTHATMLAEAGAPANYVSQRLGHKNVSTTLNIYYHLSDGLREQGDDFLNQKF